MSFLNKIKSSASYLYSNSVKYFEAAVPSITHDTLVNSLKAMASLTVYTARFAYDTLSDAMDLLEIGKPKSTYENYKKNSATFTEADSVTPIQLIQEFITNKWNEKDNSNLGHARNEIITHPGLKIALDTVEYAKNITLDIILCDIIGGTLTSMLSANSKGWESLSNQSDKNLYQESCANLSKEIELATFNEHTAPVQFLIDADNYQPYDFSATTEVTGEASEYGLVL
jgi:hypothetical protein